MWFSWATCLIVPLVSSLVTGNTIRIGVSTDEVDTLAEEAFQNKIDYDSSSQQASNKTCSVENAAVRREW